VDTENNMSRNFSYRGAVSGVPTAKLCFPKYRLPHFCVPAHDYEAPHHG